MRLMRDLFLCSCILVLFGCNSTDNKGTQALSNSSYKEHSEEELLERTVKPYLEGTLWSERDKYDATNFLMVPLHYAFQSKNNELINDFHNHFINFSKHGVQEFDNRKDNQRLSNLQYYYLISRYIVLSQDTEMEIEEKENLDFLAMYLLTEIEHFWSEIPAWQWGRDPFIGGMKERIFWKLDNKIVDLSYYRAIIDEELFMMAIAADLSQYFKDNLLLKEIINTSYNVFETEGTFLEDSGWLFQIGVWDDHPEYAFVGYEDKKDVNDKKTIENTVTDSSHFHRFPLWLLSFKEAFSEGTEENKLFSRIQLGLEKQFFDHVLKSPSTDFPYYRLTNFMDGTNGVYRWDYATSRGDGYGPYELSGTFTIGWWTFLGTERIKNVYKNLYEQYPLSQETVDLYVGPNTTRDRNPYIVDPDSYFNGYKELLALLASKVK